MGAMLGVVLSDNLIILYLFWELTSFSSFYLSHFGEKKASIYGAQKSLIITVLGGLSLLGGIILLSLAAHTFSIQTMIEKASDIQNSPFFILAMVLVMIGAFTKSAQVPFYIWLPDAMEAPTPVSAYLHSASMVKAGLYLIARMTPIFAISEGWVWTITLVGLVTLFGFIKCHKTTRFKRHFGIFNCISTWNDYVHVRYRCSELSLQWC